MECKIALWGFSGGLVRIRRIYSCRRLNKSLPITAHSNISTSYAGIGVMTGTSLDGTDLAQCKFTETEGKWAFEIVCAESIPMDKVWHDRLFCLADQSAEVYAKTNVYFGHYLGKEIQGFIQRNNLKPQYVACHGQTIFHQPDKSFTAQIGDGETISSYLDCLLVTNFRNKDVALGGQGAPLVPFGEKFLFPENKLFLNLGGIANLSFAALGFDISPCNLLLNHLAFRHDASCSYDPEGSIARSGLLIPDLFQQMESLPFYTQKPPKSLGREWIEQEIFPLVSHEDHSTEDLLRTSVEHIASRISTDIRRAGAKGETMLVTGGGARNTFLMEVLQEKLQSIQVNIDLSLPASLTDMKEALIFSFLGLNVLLGQSNILSSVTGASQAVPGGSIHLPAKGGITPLI